MRLPSWLKGMLTGLATLILAGSDAAGIEHATIAKTIAGIVLALLAGDAVTKNDAAAKTLADGVEVVQKEARFREAVKREEGRR